MTETSLEVFGFIGNNLCGFNLSSRVPQGESPTKWRTAEFRLFRGGSLWRPPILNSYTERSDEGAAVEEAAPPEEEVKKGQLRAE